MSETPCAVVWCGAIATKGTFCAVHAADPDYDPAKPQNNTSVARGGADIEPSASPSTTES